MAGGPSTPALAAAVANSGGLGSLGFAYSAPDRVAADLRAARELPVGPLNANFFVFPQVTAPAAHSVVRAVAALQSLPGAAGLSAATLAGPVCPELERQLEPVWQLRPAV